MSLARIGVVTTSYPRWPGDAAGQWVAAHARWLADRGHAVTVVAAGDGAADAIAGVRVVRVADRGNLFYGGGAPEALEARAVGGAIAGVRFSAALAGAVRREARGWDALACHWLAPSAVVAAPLARGPMLAIAHSGDVHVLARRGLLAPALATLLARRARLVFVAPELLALARAALPRVLHGALDDAALVHPMGLDLAPLAAIAARRAGRRPGARPRLGVVGRLVPVKGVDVLLDALAHLPPVDVEIAGDGPARAALEARAAAAPARHRIRFHGHLPPARRDALLADIDVLVAPSVVQPGGRTEGTPTAVLEAVAAAVPVVASDAGGLASLPASWARRFAAGDPRALAAIVVELLADRGIQARASEAARSARVLGWDVVGKRLFDHWFRAA